MTITVMDLVNYAHIGNIPEYDFFNFLSIGHFQWMQLFVMKEKDGLTVTRCYLNVFCWQNSIQNLGEDTLNYRKYQAVCGLYKPRTGHTGRIGRTVQCKNHAPAILADRCESTVVSAI